MSVPHTESRKEKQGLDRIASEFFVKCFRAYLECSDEVQAVIRKMAEIVEDPEATGDERDMAIATIAEALFPDPRMGVDIAEWEEADADAPELSEELDAEEETFARRLKSLMEKKGLNQSQLAEAVGVGQPAISLMLRRNCRPQRRTVLKLAKALGVKPQELWPNIGE